MKRSIVIQLGIGKKLNIWLQHTRTLAQMLNAYSQLHYPHPNPQYPCPGAEQKQQQLLLQASLFPHESTVHCTHIDNDKYMGIIKSWNLFLCAYNRGQLTQPHAPSHKTQPCPIMQAAPKRRISSENTENVICLETPNLKSGNASTNAKTKTATTTTITVTRQCKQLGGRRLNQTGPETRTLSFSDLLRVECIARNVWQNVCSEFSNFANICVVIRRLS